MPSEASPHADARSRIGSIDSLRGLVMLLMLLDHTREFFHLGHQVPDPIDMAATPNAVAATRIASHLCAPVFVALTGLAAWLYGAGRRTEATSAFLLRRGPFLVLLQDRGYLDIAPGLRARRSYPVLPWIGVIALGYGIGPWFAPAGVTAGRQRRLLLTGAALFALLRLANGYGEPVPWSLRADGLAAALGIVNLTKYPPSLDLLLVTLGIGATLLAAFEGVRGRWLVVVGAPPLFFYVVHLYVLHLHVVVATAMGHVAYDVPSVAWVWLIAVMLAPPLWLATRWFGGVKRTSELWWVRYL